MCIALSSSKGHSWASRRQDVGTCASWKQAQEAYAFRGYRGRVTCALRHAKSSLELLHRRKIDGIVHAAESDVFPLDRPETEETMQQHQKAVVLMEIALAGEELDSMIEKYASEIDDQMIQILDDRIMAARRMSEKTDAVTGLVLLKRRLLAELEYRSASPAMRLLNEIIGLMPATADADELEQDLEIEDVLRAAFQPPEPPHVDIFGTAARVARGEEVDPIVPDDGDYVPQHIFIKETQQFLLTSARNVMVMGKQLSRQRKAGKRDAAQEHAFNMRSIALDQIDHILAIAKRI